MIEVVDLLLPQAGRVARRGRRCGSCRVRSRCCCWRCGCAPTSSTCCRCTSARSPRPSCVVALAGSAISLAFIQRSTDRWTPCAYMSTLPLPGLALGGLAPPAALVDEMARLQAPVAGAREEGAGRRRRRRRRGLVPAPPRAFRAATGAAGRRSERPTPAILADAAPRVQAADAHGNSRFRPAGETSARLLTPFSLDSVSTAADRLGAMSDHAVQRWLEQSWSNTARCRRRSSSPVLATAPRWRCTGRPTGPTTSTCWRWPGGRRQRRRPQPARAAGRAASCCAR